MEETGMTVNRQGNAGVSRRAFVGGTAAAAALAALPGCSSDSGSDSGSAPTGDLAFDNTAWNYDADNDVYWQVGCLYCTSPMLEAYESMGLYVPGAYLDGTANSDGETYTCTVNESGAQGDFTAATAPIVIPVNTAGYAAQAAPTSYSYTSVSAYLEEGFIYAYPGCRGRDNGESDDGSLTYGGGAPWGVTDLKAAVRYLRYNASILPGDTDAIFTFGHSGGGAQSSLMGATGDSDLYTPYLEAIGAAMTDDDGNDISDAIAGAMCWCPITCLDEADAGYEWQMGQFASTGTRAEGTFTAALSADLAEAYALRVNEMGLVDESGEALTLEESSDGVYLDGSYAEAVLAAVETSLNNFLEDTEFPYSPSSTTMADAGLGAGLSGDTTDADGLPSGDLGDLEDLDTSELPDTDADIDLDSGSLPSGDVEDLDLEDLDTSELPDDAASGTATLDTDEVVDGDIADESDLADGVARIDLGDDAVEGADATADSDASATSYETAADYIDSLNADEEWISYDESANTATVASLGAFARVCKAPTKDVCAFDDLSLSQAENKVFNNGAEEGLHFDRLLTDLLAENADSYAEYSDWNASYPEEYESDLAETDTVGLSVEERTCLYNPLYYVLPSSEGYGSSTPAPHWRIRTGITQGDTALTTELNLSWALGACDGVEDVDFATVWGQGHTTAERTGDSDTNFISWVKSCL